MSKKRKKEGLDQIIEENKGPIEFSEWVIEEIPLYGKSVEYSVCFVQYMIEVIVDSSKNPKYDFYNVGENLAFWMHSHCGGQGLNKRDYDKECVQLKNTYKALIGRIEEIRKTTSKDSLELPVNSLIRSIDTFLDGVLDGTWTREVLSVPPINYKLQADVSICHDCFTQIYDMLNEPEIFVLGDLAEV